MKMWYVSTATQAAISVPENFRLTKNFVLNELANNEGDPSIPQYMISEYSMHFNELLQIFRDRYGMPIDPTSGYRQAAYNKKVGGDTNSLHRKACAMDFIDKYKNKDTRILSLWLGVLYDNGITGAINIYGNNGLYRYHVEAFSDIFLGYKKNRIRVYTNKEHYTVLATLYGPLGIEVTYNGK